MQMLSAQSHLIRVKKKAKGDSGHSRSERHLAEFGLMSHLSLNALHQMEAVQYICLKRNY